MRQAPATIGESPGDATAPFMRVIPSDSGRQRAAGALAQMALAWLLRRPVVASMVIGASCALHIDEVAALIAPEFSDTELAAIDVASAHTTEGKR